MTSRPGPGIQESLQHRGGGSAYLPGRWATNPQHGDPDPAAEGERGLAEARVTKARPKGKPVPLDAIQTTAVDRVRPTPRGAPQLFFSNAPPGENELPAQRQLLTNLPVPPRPGPSAPSDVLQQRRIVPGGTGVKDGAATEPQGIDAPAPALVFPAGKTVDLFPWTGNHPEDVLSEALVKGGIANKSQIMNETSSARGSLWSNLKNNAGMSTLSTLFVAVLEKRQSLNRLTTPHTFKPPPRLTLRDSTRENWLKDLANPTVRLGRLSRTIPTGVTGKVLLEQCLNKNIPIPRAMWLAKCIGINELRTHKRKGQSGSNNYYTTWVRGWTSAVEQFLDDIVATIGQEEWKPRMTYALQLTTHLFKERLLEEDHYLDWALKSLESCSSERLFFWLLVVCIPDFWLCLVSYRRRGKRLAESLLAHAEKLYGLEEAQNTPVLALVENTIFKLVVTKPTCLLLPKTWEKHGSTLGTFAQRRALAQITHTVAGLDARNVQFSQSVGVPSSTSKDAAERIYHLLDSVDYNASIRIDELAYDCMEIRSDAGSLVSAAMQWASSIYREGSHHIYLATRLLRRWNHLGADIYSSILQYLSTLVSDASKEPAVVFRIIAELLRSKTFSLGRYLQWLIATGSLTQHTDLYSPSAWPLRLITEIPLSGLSIHVRNLRRTLLRGTVYPVDAEEQAVASTQDAIRQQLPGLFEAHMSDCRCATVDVALLNPTVRLEVGIWLREQVVASMEFVECIPTNDPAIVVSGSVCRITLPDFHIIRTYMEELNDLTILADIIGIVATSFDPNVLSAAADTLHYHYVAFRAIGAFEPLFEKLAMRYAAIRTVRFPERELLYSLIDLSRTAGANPELMQLMSYDISRYDQKNSLAVCSPVSDNMMEGVVALDVEEEIERILSSGTSMDQQMMNRVFGKIAKYMEDQLFQGHQRTESFSTWLYRLRSFDEATFDKVLSSWLRSLLLSHQLRLLSAALPPLVATGTLSLSRFLTTIRECFQARQTMRPAEVVRIAVDGLERILPSRKLDGDCHPQDQYRFRLEQYKYCRLAGGNLLSLVRDVLELEVTVGDHESEKVLSTVLTDDRLISVLRHLAVHESQALSMLIDVGTAGAVEERFARVKLVLNRLLDPRNILGLSSIDREQQVSVVVQHADSLSLPFCQLVLRHIFSKCISEAEDEADRVSAALVAAVRTAIDEDRPCWPSLIAGLEPGLTNKIREHAEREIINASRLLCPPFALMDDEAVGNKQASVHKYLSVIDATCAGIGQEAQPLILVALVERLKGVVDLLNSWKDGHKNEVPASGVISPNFDLCYWLRALLRLAVIHGPALVTKASNQHQGALMWTLRTLISHPGLDRFPSTALSLFDLAALLSDSISEDVRKQLSYRDAAKPVDDDRCTFIFGSTPPSDGWLILTQPVNAILHGQAEASSQAHLPTMNASPSQHGGQFQQTTGSGGLQRSSSQQQSSPAGQSPNFGRTFSHLGQGQKMAPQQLQRMGSNGQGGPSTQLQQMQQMQSLAQQRNMQASHSQQQRMPINQGQSPTTGKVANAKQSKVEMRHVPFTLNRWEVLPECGSNAMGNETAVSLSLFGARKV